MLNVFPIMFLSLLAHALLRVFVGGALLYLGIQHATKKRQELGIHFSKVGGSVFVWCIALIEITIGTMFIVGAWTQIAALALMLVSVLMLIFRKDMAHSALPSPMVYILFLGASLSLFITGAGAFAVDLPI